MCLGVSDFALQITIGQGSLLVAEGYLFLTFQ